jgi:integrase
MDNYLSELKKSVSENSYNQYARIYKILDIKDGPEIEDHRLIWAKMEDKSANTRKNYLAALVKLLRMHPESDKRDKLIATYTEMMNKEIENTKPSPHYNEKQKSNLMTMAEIDNIRDTMLEGIRPSEFTERVNYDTLLDHMILSLYTLMPPRRNEFYDMKIARKPSEVDTTGNWLLWTPKKRDFIFQRYKTAKTYGTERLPIPAPLMKILSNYMRYRDVIALPGNDRLLVRYGNQNLENSNDITRTLNRILKKKIGASMLRHIYLTEKYGKVIKMMDADATALGHSVDQQREYIKT